VNESQRDFFYAVAGGKTIPADPPVAAFNATSATVAAGTTLDTAAINLGNYADETLLILVYTCNGARTLVSCQVTPGGGGAIAGTVVEAGAATFQSACIGQILIPAGTDLTSCVVRVVVSSATFDGGQIRFWTVPRANLNSTTAVSTATNGASATTLSVDLTTQANGFIVAVASHADETSSSCAWTGDEVMNERADSLSNSINFTMADASGISAGTRRVTATYTNDGSSGTAMRVSAATWR
jgi:hypothetical protein